jgi:protein TonB
MTRGSPFFFLVIASGLVHFVGAGGALVYLSGGETRTDERASITIALGSRGSSVGQPEAMAPKEEPVTLQETPPVSKPDAKPVPRAVPEPLPIAEPVQAIDPAPVKEEVPESQVIPVEVERQPSVIPGNSGFAGMSDESEVDTDGDSEEAGYQALLASYDGIVLGHLAKFKTFPPSARMRGEEGHVGVEFVIDRNGQLAECRLLKSSGSRRLDKAALRQLRSAVPYPSAPVEADWSMRTYRTEMRYSLN